MPNRHHGDHDYGAIIDGSLGQKSVKASSPIHGDQREAQYLEYSANHYVVYASNLITEVMDLKTGHTLDLHLVRASLQKACNHLCSGREVVNRPRVLWVTHPWHFSNSTDEIRGHMDLRPSNPSEEGITDSLVDVGIELSHQLCYGWTVILHHLSPTLGL
jgi:hypothetical protein